MRNNILVFLLLVFALSAFAAEDVKAPNVAGSFYPADPQELSETMDKLLAMAKPEEIQGDIFALISPHAGYAFSGATAAFGYKLIQGKSYKTVVIIGVSHQYPLPGVSVYPKGALSTPLGNLEIDSDFTSKLIGKESEIFFAPLAFAKEHSVEVQLPFLQKLLGGSARKDNSTSASYSWKIVPILMGDCNLATCEKLAQLLRIAIGKRQDILVVASTDMYHGYDYDEAAAVDSLTLSYLKNMDTAGLYEGLRNGRAQLCAGPAVLTTLKLAEELGHTKLKVLNYTNSALVTGKKEKGIWTVGYVSCVIDNPNPERKVKMMLNKNQRKKLLDIARSSIETYLKVGKKMEVAETDAVLQKNMGAFVTLHKHGQLRGCIGNLIGSQPLYLTVRDMAVEAAVDDPRFPPVELPELKEIEIEISALSPLERVNDTAGIEMGVHGVLIRKGFRSGVYLPQVATETGWSKEDFLSSLCAHKAGLPADAWKDKATEIYIFTAEVFSENKIE